MTKIPNVDWFQLQQDGINHPTSSLEDNMRAVRNQFGGRPRDEEGQPLCKCGHPYGWHAHRGACGGPCGCAEYDDGSGELQARDAKRASQCQCPYGWHAIHKDCYPHLRVELGPGEAVIINLDVPPSGEMKKAEEGVRRAFGVGETIFSPEEIAQFQEAALAVYTESMNKVQAANETRTQEGRYPLLPSQFKDIARLEMQKLAYERRYLEGDTEFSDEDVADYYLGKVR